GETLARTNLGALQPGNKVNLERCMPAGGRFDGHVVQGHVDGLGQVAQIVDHASWRTIRFTLPTELAGHLAEKGSITISGVSLTVTAVSPAGSTQPWFEVGLIPATLEATTLGQLSVGDTVNLETDALAKYVQRLLETSGAIAATGSADLAAGAAAGVPTYQLDSIPQAIAAIAAGQAVVVVDDEGRENEGDIIFAAEHATEALMGFTVRYTSGVICAPMPAARADALGLPPMTAINEDAKGTAYTVSCDARTGVTTGISAADRARTVRVLADAASTPGDLTRPGHIFPLRAVDGGVRQRPGHTEAAVELSLLAGLSGVGVIAELVHDQGHMMRFDALRTFATEHKLPMISIADLVTYLEGQHA
ncbi:MAG: 3,4-dihydroxy-2-butanone-4-phosphate synthase, partial [Rothia sp. (in: high G+C Gram-positive bacteria)]|nr:3,4-dihydroxy-2-butanone-4-phosphate synthase [Rothia sp. (in: high G+C Gram-positive bacteria)]